MSAKLEITHGLRPSNILSSLFAPVMFAESPLLILSKIFRNLNHLDRELLKIVFLSGLCPIVSNIMFFHQSLKRENIKFATCYTYSDLKAVFVSK